MADSISKTEKVLAHFSQTDNGVAAHEKAGHTKFVIFSDLCSNLLNRVTHKKMISERNLWDFNKMAIGLICDTLKELPKPYIELYEHLSDYWRYELESETDSERKYSYIRLYQASSLLKACYEDRKEEEGAVSFLDKYKASYELLRKIQNKPGITLKMLQDSLSVSAGSVSSAALKDVSDQMIRQLDRLEKDGFLLKRGPEEDPYYILTHTGDILYKKIKDRKKRDVWTHPWNHERIIFFLYMIGQLADRYDINGSQIQWLLQIILTMDDNLIIQCMEKIGTEYQNVLEKNDAFTFYSNKQIALEKPYFSSALSANGILAHKKEYDKKTLDYVSFNNINAGNFIKRAGILELAWAELMSAIKQVGR